MKIEGVTSMTSEITDKWLAELERSCDPEDHHGAALLTLIAELRRMRRQNKLMAQELERMSKLVK